MQFQSRTSNQFNECEDFVWIIGTQFDIQREYGNQKGILNRNHCDGIIFLPVSQQPRGSKFRISQKHPSNAQQTAIQSAFQTHATQTVDPTTAIDPKSTANTNATIQFQLPLPCLYSTKWATKPNHIERLKQHVGDHL